MCYRILKKNGRVTLACVLFFVTMYSLISFMYLEIGIVIKEGDVFNFAGVNIDMKRTQQDSESTGCLVDYIPAAHRIPYSSNLTCKQHRPSQAACKFTKEFYKYEFDKWKCDSSQEIRICEMSSDARKLVCNYSACGLMFNGEIVLHLFDDESGAVRPLQRGFRNNEELNENIMGYAQGMLMKGYPFLFLSCGMNEKQTQLVILQKSILNDKLQTQEPSSPSNINVNLILLDSVARAHFYRSLKQTIGLFSNINTRTSKKAEILDFEFDQAIHGHTTENLHGLMNGKLLPGTISDQDKEATKTEFNNMLKYFKTRGYEILYQEDECWQGMWGINADLGAFEYWKDLHIEIKKNTSIDDTGLLFASCKIIELYEPEKKHVFNMDGSIKLCYNGKSQDYYYLQYIADKIRHTNNKNLFSFTALNMAHDGTGRRIQGLDSDLKEFVKTMSEEKNTLTILFADHGNTYTDFVYIDMEGKYEMYHPSLFMVIPDTVARKLGDEKMHALRMNQKRLMNLIDVHHMLKHIADPLDHPRKGLLEIVSSDRNCDKIPMATPNLCICAGFDSPVKNTSDYLPHVEFAVGHVNNLINIASKEGRCKRLVPTRFENVRQKKNAESVILSFDIFTTPGKGSKNIEERIYVEMSYTVTEKGNNFNTKVLSFDRISRFGPYRKCSDAPGTFRYCVCDQVSQNKARLKNVENLLPIRNEHTYHKILGDRIEESFSYLIEDELALLERKIFDIEDRSGDKMLIGVSFEAVNMVDTSYNVEIMFDSLDNMKPMSTEKCEGSVKRFGMTYLCSLMRVWSIAPAGYAYKGWYKKIPDDGKIS